MKFEDPKFLHLLWLSIPLCIFFWWSWKNYLSRMTRFVEQGLLKSVVVGFSRRRTFIKRGLILLSVIFVFISLARPQWGFEWQEVKRQGIDVLVVIDTSKSMLTQDIKPNRLERTKYAVKDLLKKLQGDRIGLIAFSGDAFLLCPLTSDYNGFLMSLNDLNINSIGRGGTNISSAIDEALKSFDDTPKQHKAIIIVTDGENLEGEPLKAAQQASDEGLKIFTVGVGTREGELIQLTNDSGERTFLKDDQGNFIKSRLNEQLLNEIAAKTGGLYIKASGAQFGLEYIYEQQLVNMEKREFDSRMEQKFYERYHIPLSLAFVFLFIEICLPTRKE